MIKKPCSVSVDKNIPVKIAMTVRRFPFKYRNRSDFVETAIKNLLKKHE